MNIRCVECNQPIENPGQALREVLGFTKPRRGGGVHHVLFRKETGRLMCGDCGVRKQTTGHATQGSLL